MSNAAELIQNEDPADSWAQAAITLKPLIVSPAHWGESEWPHILCPFYF